MIDVVDDEPVELPLVPDDGAVEELASQGAQPAFGERIRHRSAHRRLEDLHSFGSEDLVEGVDELASAVAHERPGVGESVAASEQQVSGGLADPDTGGAARDPSEAHSPGRDVDGGEVAGDGGLRSPELRPGDSRACGCGVDSGGRCGWVQ